MALILRMSQTSKFFLVYAIILQYLKAKNVRDATDSLLNASN
jgi:hypothetical protein